MMQYIIHYITDFQFTGATREQQTEYQERPKHSKESEEINRCNNTNILQIIVSK
jgi:hypothetical protein